MSANLTLIDDLGMVWDGGSPRLRKSFGSPASREEFSTYVVKNMGFIAVHSYGKSCEIRLRPSLVTSVAFRALKDWMTGRNFQRVVTVQFDSDWGYGLHVNQEMALAKIESLLMACRQSRPSDRLSRALKKDELPRVTAEQQALHSLIENWPMLSQSVHREGLWKIINQSLKGRYHLIDAHKSSRELVFREIGKGFISYTDDWLSRAIGQSIELQEDAAYGRWVASVYREALSTCQPMICDVDVITSTRKLGRTRLRYKRVLLPCRSVGGGNWLLNSSIIDTSIDLRTDQVGKVA
jgi:hypothetical protein